MYHKFINLLNHLSLTSTLINFCVCVKYSRFSPQPVPEKVLDVLERQQQNDDNEVQLDPDEFIIPRV